MTRHQKRWLCWGTAIAVFAAYIITLTIHWAGAWPTYPTGVVGLVVIVTVTLEVAGWRAGIQPPIMVAIRNDGPTEPPRPPAVPPAEMGPKLPRFNTVDLRRAEAEAYVDRLSGGYRGIRTSRRKFIPPQ